MSKPLSFLAPHAAIRTAGYGVFAIIAATLAACGGANSESGTAATPEAGGGAAAIAEDHGALGDMTMGSPDAPVTMIEYASVTCPHCATFHEQVLPAVKKDFIDTGKVRMVFREFPTAPANLSFAGSMVARCAAEKAGSDEAYFVVLNSLFANQRTWIMADSPREELVKIASQAGMSEADFDACVKRQELLDFLNKNIKEATDKYDINSTPSFVVNGQVRHFSSIEEVTRTLNEAVEKAEAAKAAQ